MKVLTTTEARKVLPELINQVRYRRQMVAIGRRQQAEVLLVKFPEHYNVNLSDTTNMNQYGRSFDWLEAEPDIYSRSDLKKSYVWAW